MLSILSSIGTCKPREYRLWSPMKGFMNSYNGAEKNHYSILAAAHLLERIDSAKRPRWKCEKLYCKVQN